MPEPSILSSPPVTALAARTHVTDLEAERKLALAAGLGRIELYMDDLEEELVLWRAIYAIAAVTEIATLRAELFGPEIG